MVFASTRNYADIRGTADAVDEISDALTYIGLCKPGCTGTDQLAWSICRIEKFGTVTLIKWANGNCSFNLVWDDRAGYEYKFKKF